MSGSTDRDGGDGGGPTVEAPPPPTTSTDVTAEGASAAAGEASAPSAEASQPPSGGPLAARAAAKSAPEPPRWRFTNEAKKSFGYRSLDAGTPVAGRTSEELGAPYVAPPSSDSSSNDDASRRIARSRRRRGDGWKSEYVVPRVRKFAKGEEEVGRLVLIGGAEEVAKATARRPIGGGAKGPPVGGQIDPPGGAEGTRGTFSGPTKRESEGRGNRSSDEDERERVRRQGKQERVEQQQQQQKQQQQQQQPALMESILQRVAVQLQQMTSWHERHEQQRQEQTQEEQHERQEQQRQEQQRHEQQRQEQQQSRQSEIILQQIVGQLERMQQRQEQQPPEGAENTLQEVVAQLQQMQTQQRPEQHRPAQTESVLQGIVAQLQHMQRRQEEQRPGPTESVLQHVVLQLQHMQAQQHELQQQWQQEHQRQQQQQRQQLQHLQSSDHAMSSQKDRSDMVRPHEGTVRARGSPGREDAFVGDVPTGINRNGDGFSDDVFGYDDLVEPGEGGSLLLHNREYAAASIDSTSSVALMVVDGDRKRRKKRYCLYLLLLLLFLLVVVLAALLGARNGRDGDSAAATAGATGNAFVSPPAIFASGSSNGTSAPSSDSTSSPTAPRTSRPTSSPSTECPPGTKALTVEHAHQGDLYLSSAGDSSLNDSVESGLSWTVTDACSGEVVSRCPICPGSGPSLLQKRHRPLVNYVTECLPVGNEYALELLPTVVRKRWRTCCGYGISYDDVAIAHGASDDRSIANMGEAIYFGEAKVPCPSATPSMEPTEEPSDHPSEPPSASPTEAPTSHPTASPTSNPTGSPSRSPNRTPTDGPTLHPSIPPSIAPIGSPTVASTERKPTRSPTGGPTPQPTCSVEQDFNLCLAVDMSGSVCNAGTGHDCRNCRSGFLSFFAFLNPCRDGFLNEDTCCVNFSRVQDFSALMVDALGDLPGDNKFSLVQFADDAKVVKELSSRARTIQAIMNMDYSGGQTNHADAIRACQRTLTSSSNYGRKNFIVLVTDGESSVPGFDPEGAAESAAMSAKSDGTFIIPVFISPYGNDPGAYSFMSRLSRDGKVFDVMDFSSLNGLQDRLVEQVSCS